VAKKSDERKLAEKELKKKAKKEKETAKVVEEEKKEAVKEESGKEPAKKEKVKAEAPKEGKAEKKDEKEEKPERKIIKESIHTINLKKAYELTRTKRTKYSIREIKRYVKKHARKPARITPAVNEKLWENGIQNPPRKIKVKLEEEESIVTVDLV